MSLVRIGLTTALVGQAYRLFNGVGQSEAQPDRRDACPTILLLQLK